MHFNRSLQAIKYEQVVWKSFCINMSIAMSPLMHVRNSGFTNLFPSAFLYFYLFVTVPQTSGICVISVYLFKAVKQQLPVLIFTL